MDQKPKKVRLTSAESGLSIWLWLLQRLPSLLSLCCLSGKTALMCEHIKKVREFAS